MADFRALPILATLVSYPDALNGPEGDALAALLSEVGSAAFTDHGLGDDTKEPVDARLEKAFTTFSALEDATTPREMRRSLVSSSAAILTVVRLIDRDLLPLMDGADD